MTGQERRTPRQTETDGQAKEKRSPRRAAFVAPPSLAAHFSPSRPRRDKVLMTRRPPRIIKAASAYVSKRARARAHELPVALTENFITICSHTCFFAAS